MNRRKAKIQILFTLLVLIFALSACTQKSDVELYRGKKLNIAVVGELPKVVEEQVSFYTISFDELINEELDYYDAVLITEENLNEASKSQYTDVYLNSSIPFFFISAKNHIPFTMKEVEYDNSWNWTMGDNYAVGILTSKEDDILKSWGYGLYNDKKTDHHVEEVFSRIFKTIEDEQSF